jgi:hypothetical protein
MNDELIAFIEELRVWLQSIVHAPACFLAADPRLDEYREAWEEVEERFEELVARLRSMPEKERSFFGLGGKQLWLKLTGHAAAKRPYDRWPTLKGFKKVLRWAGVIIGSVSKAFPAAAEAIKELIETLQATTEEIEEYRDEEKATFRKRWRGLRWSVDPAVLMRAERQWETKWNN